MSLCETAVTYGSYAAKYKSRRSLSQFYVYAPPKQRPRTPAALRDNIDLCKPANLSRSYRSTMFLEQTKGHEFFGRPESPKKLRIPQCYANRETSYVSPARKHRNVDYLKSSISLSSAAPEPVV